MCEKHHRFCRLVDCTSALIYKSKCKLFQSNIVLSHRDRIHIIQDIIVKLVEYGGLNRTDLIRFCGLNLKKHRCILDELQINGLVSVIQFSVGRRRIWTYKSTQKGIEFCRTILEPYEKMFPRTGQHIIIVNNDNIYNKNDDNKGSSSIIEIKKRRSASTTTARAPSSSPAEILEHEVRKIRTSIEI